MEVQFNNYVYDEASVTLNKFIKAFYPVTYACYYSLFEFVQIGTEYFMTIQDLNKIAYNLIHNLGRLYDDIDELISLFMSI